MSSFATIKNKCNRYLYTSVYNYTKAKKRVKAIESNTRKYEKLVDEMKIIKRIKLHLNIKLLFGIETKKSYINLHFFKILEHYIYLRFYHKNIQKLSYNERLLCYLESVIEFKGLDPKEWDFEYRLVGNFRVIIENNQEVIFYKDNLFLFDTHY